MSYDHVVSDIVSVVEGTGAVIMIAGAVGAFWKYLASLLRREAGDLPYVELRRHLGRSILLGLEVLIIGDIIRTIVVDPTIRSVSVLGIVVVIRIVLSFALEVEIDGVWPWSRWRLEQGDRPRNP